MVVVRPAFVNLSIGDSFMQGEGTPVCRCDWATQFAIDGAVQPNSFARSPSLRPARTSSTICWRSSGVYGGLVRGIVDSCAKNQGPRERVNSNPAVLL